MRNCVKVGFAVHMIGIFADLSMVFRVRSLNKRFRFYALVAVSIYTFLFTGWLLYLHIVRYNPIGKVCSGDYFDSEPDASLDSFAIHQGTVLRNIIIGVWCANGSIFGFAVFADLIG